MERMRIAQAQRRTGITSPCRGALHSDRATQAGQQPKPTPESPTVLHTFPLLCLPPTLSLRRRFFSLPLLQALSVQKLNTPISADTWGLCRRSPSHARQCHGKAITRLQVYYYMV